MAEKLMKTVFDWEHFAIYLSGPMDFTEDGGKDWREEWTDKLVNIGINRKQIYNPCKKPFNSAQFNLDNEAAIWEQCRKTENWELMEQTVSQVMHIDLRLVDKADIVLVNIPKIGWHNKYICEMEEQISNFEDNYKYEKGNNLGTAAHQLMKAYAESRVPTYGTIHEIVIAHLQRKPIFLVWEGDGLKGCSAWLMKLIGHKNIFAYTDELIKHLDAISHGEKAFDANEWLLIDPK